VLVFQKHVISFVHSSVSNNSNRAFEVSCLGPERTVSHVTHEFMTVNVVLNETVFSSALQFELCVTAV
jgi:hypothetical protein